MVRAHLARLFRDRRLLACVLLALLLAVYAGQPTVYERTLERLQEVPLQDLIDMYDLTHIIGKDKITREDANRFFAPFGLSTVLCRTRSGPMLAAFVGSYLVGGWLKHKANCDIYTGHSRRRAALGICAITGIVAALLSLLTTLLVCVIYGWECLRFAVPADIASRLIPALVWRMFFDVAAFAPVVFIAFISRERQVPLLVGTVLALVTSGLYMFPEALWWFPIYAAETMIAYTQDLPGVLRLTMPSLAMIVITVLFAVARMERAELR